MGKGFHKFHRCPKPDCSCPKLSAKVLKARSGVLDLTPVDMPCSRAFVCHLNLPFDESHMRQEAPRTALRTMVCDAMIIKASSFYDALCLPGENLIKPRFHCSWCLSGADYIE